MKKQLAVLLLMLCTIAAQAQLMGPGYIMGNQQEKINHPKTAKIYEALYEAVDKNDCATFKKILDTGINPNMVVVEQDGVAARFRYTPSYYKESFDADFFDGRTVPAKLSLSEDVGKKRYYLYKAAEQATVRGNVCILQELQAHKFNWINPDTLPGGAGYLLWDAIQNKHVDVVKFFLEMPGKEGRMIRWRVRDVEDAQALIAQAEAEAAKAQQQAVQREVKASFPKKK